MPQGLLEGFGWPLVFAARLGAGFLAFRSTTFLGVGLFAANFFTAGFFLAAFTAVFTFVLRAAMWVLLYFFFSALCGFRLPMRPDSLPAAGSSTALIRVGLPESIAAFTARLSSSGVVALTPVPPKASIILS